MTFLEIQYIYSSFFLSFTYEANLKILYVTFRKPLLLMTLVAVKMNCSPVARAHISKLTLALYPLDFPQKNSPNSLQAATKVGRGLGF